MTVSEVEVLATGCGLAVDRPCNGDLVCSVVAKIDGHCRAGNIGNRLHDYDCALPVADILAAEFNPCGAGDDGGT